MSDMILVSNAKQFGELCRWSLQATNCGLVGSAYTYFGISGKLLNKDIGEWSGEAEQDRIPFMAIRFSVRGSEVGEELRKVRK